MGTLCLLKWKERAKPLHKLVGPERKTNNEADRLPTLAALLLIRLATSTGFNPVISEYLSEVA